MITKIRKRDGRLVDYDISKIENAIAKAMMSLGDSMLPEIPPKAYCIIKKMDIPLNNKNMLIKTTDGFTIKRVKVIDGKIRLYFLNPANKELKASSVQIIGKVIGIYQKY